MDLKSLNAALSQIAAEKAIAPEKVLAAIESSIAAAYKKEYRKKTELIKAKFDLKTGDLKFWQVKIVVDPSEVRIVEEPVETEVAAGKGSGLPAEVLTKEEEEQLLPRYNPDRHIFLEEAKKIKKEAVVGEELEFPLETHADFGRIAAQTAKQVILQNLREAERASVKEEYADKEGQIVSGTVQRFERGNVYIDLGRAIGILFYNESIPGEHYRVGQRLRFYVLAVQDDPRRPGIILSRSHPKFVVKLFEMEVPEMADGIVEIKAIAREPGSRTKIAVASNQDGVDPVGSVVGQRGTRVMAVTNELGNEKIDVTEYSDDPQKFIASAISPAKAKLVELSDRREAKVLVAEDQLSLAIGKGGQNVRLAAKLTGWKIDVRSQSRPEEAQEGGVAEVPEVPPIEEKTETKE
ncbi:MAG: NusA antitermination factor [Candidatus Jorgensenbacteria bacterium GW2011_GWA1_48_11]|uniref:Transcription termination/antitermination protein NusA n=1 Tax=Candidatus Jorgensenbacteria bacterium GW2011_GWA1_48_11 TaxID=1618660 RepID=A0A0G1UBY0_9BACT|nr:MAG: NusA antitermination factor [Candidatus Jorgensenbacteria bacterium GW2011_GWA1_48_11]KKW12119.1 MAG: NusA antitermination factor [Candidatus Jorgensenbacteria bacterium GW2011_GWB1_49_9]